jgi:hypothetical protein
MMNLYRSCFRQNLQSRLLKIGDFAPDIEVMARALWGRLANPERHRGIPFTDAAFGAFMKPGLEINKILNRFWCWGLLPLWPLSIAG